MNHKISEEILQRLTFAVYGQSIQITETIKGKSYIYDVAPIYLDYYDDNLWNAVELGYMSYLHYGVL